MCLEVGPRYRCAHEETQQEWLHLDTDDQIAAFFRGLTEPGSHTRAAATGDLMSSRGCVYFQISCRGDMVGDGSNQSQKKKKKVLQKCCSRGEAPRDVCSSRVTQICIPTICISIFTCSWPPDLFYSAPVS